MERRIAARLPIRRLNVFISGAVLSTIDISKAGVQVHCPISQFPLVEPLLAGNIEMVIELPFGREVTVFAQASHTRTHGDAVFIGFEFCSFKYRDRAGWEAFVTAKARELARNTPSLVPEKLAATR